MAGQKLGKRGQGSHAWRSRGSLEERKREVQEKEEKAEPPRGSMERSIPDEKHEPRWSWARKEVAQTGVMRAVGMRCGSGR